MTSDELMAWLEKTSDGWRALAAAHPEMLALPCDVRETENVAQALQHIVAVELRYAQRLAGLPQSGYADIPYGSGEELYRTHDEAMSLLHNVLAQPSCDWDEQIDFITRSAGTLRASRRTVLLHLAFHSIRHYAQLATLVRQHGIKPGWDMDYLFMQATPV